MRFAKPNIIIMAELNTAPVAPAITAKVVTAPSIPP
jgi:hypothetical protein